MNDDEIVTADNLNPDCYLDPDHAVEKVLLEMAHLSRRKRADYARDEDPLSNFYETAQEMRADGIHPTFTAADSVRFNLIQKRIRLRALTANQRMDDPQNEPVRDTLLDNAVYSVLLLAVHDRSNAPDPWGEGA